MKRRALMNAAVALGLPVLMSTTAVAGQGGSSLPETTVPYPGAEPARTEVSAVVGWEGPGTGQKADSQLSLSTGVVALKIERAASENSFPALSFSSPAEAPGTAVSTAAEPFSITLSGVTYPASSFECKTPKGWVVQPLAPSDKPLRGSESLAGVQVEAVFSNEKAGVEIVWRAILRDDTSYVRQEYTVKALRDVELTGFTPVSLDGSGFEVVGKVPGSPLVNEQAKLFFGVELPVAEARVSESGATISFDCVLPMKAGESHSFSTVAGAFPKGQLRRALLSYLELERAKPYHLFLQYNCWYDHGLNPTEENMLATVKAYGDELVNKRGIKLDSFVLDDGWDDYTADLWQPHPKKFPNGFGKLAEAIRAIDSNFGIWISPLGGYSGFEERAEHGRRMGLIPQEQKELDLSFPNYYNWFLARCSELMQKDGVNFFKWDRAGSGVSPHFMALLKISEQLRRINPDVFLSTTVGTWPSPFWLNFIDCTWRTGSSDVNWIGKGSNREQYITYRDASCYRIIVQQAPLYPLNSIMHHGIVLGTEFQGYRTSDARTYNAGKAEEPKDGGGDCMTDTTDHHVDFPVNNDLKHDIRMLLGAGANLQELYLTPGMMNEKAWDDVAEAVRWSRRFADVTADTHWVGGDPEKLEVYGYCSWRADRGATLALRNPDDCPKSIRLSTAIFEPTTSGAIHLRASYGDQRVRELVLPAEGEVELRLEPFEMLVFDARFDGDAAAAEQKK